MAEKNENPEQRVLDALRGYDFDLTVEDVKGRELIVRGKFAEYSDPEIDSRELDDITKKFRDKVSALGEADSWVTQTFWPDMPDAETVAKFYRTKDLSLLTPEVWAKHRRRMSKQIGDYNKMMLSSCERDLKLIDEVGVEAIYEQWRLVFEFINSQEVDDMTDVEAYQKIKEKFPEFVNRISEYMTFVRGKEWHLWAESLVLQQSCAEMLREKLKV
ncbi:hypothetical protein KJ632_03555 [Patescibacteria group bacterium]|nr:hypothetical protein [Patescibacteria group bacterium]